ASSRWSRASRCFWRACRSGSNRDARQDASGANMIALTNQPEGAAMKKLTIVVFAILFTTATVGQAQQNGDGRGPATNATGQPAASGKVIGNIEVLTNTSRLRAASPRRLRKLKI